MQASAGLALPIRCLEGAGLVSALVGECHMVTPIAVRTERVFPIRDTATRTTAGAMYRSVDIPTGTEQELLPRCGPGRKR